MNMKKNWIFAALSAMMVVSGGYAQEKGGEGLDQEPSKPKAKVDLFAIAKERMTAKRVLNTSTITDTPLAGGRRVVWSIGAKDRSIWLWAPTVSGSSWPGISASRTAISSSEPTMHGRCSPTCCRDPSTRGAEAGPLRGGIRTS